ncbi:MAG: TonB C-terminal domain-containing protein [Leptospiraceae bacterium]|nr:TonB C-terminal domain-containing protein [Leptospiraceae bacterium]MDW8306090.1 TonB C-terminal domain-containing protein [Leptospiraceae bacterium]
MEVGKHTTFRLEDRRWLIFFSLSAWFIAYLIIVERVPLKIMAHVTQQVSWTPSREIRVLLENPEEKPTREKKERVFLSNRDAMARGQLTREKGFEAISRDYKLALAKKEPHGRTAILKSRQLDSPLEVKETRDPEKKEKLIDKQEMRIPVYYEFRDRFALSWDARGKPQIPTKNFEHYHYFRRMLDKIQQHWAPPGGIPYPTFGDEYHRMSYTPGYVRYSTFPPQDIKVVFMLNRDGDVVDVKLWESLGYKALDHSCTEAIVRSKNFGPPPEELLENDALIVPMIFRIIVR